ncbi:MAG: hypothetical protein OXF06_02040 [Bacteroidetes bacterium]|nr:hypothetical protein [Bacteroidota bacterium]
MIQNSLHYSNFLQFFLDHPDRYPEYAYSWAVGFESIWHLSEVTLMALSPDGPHAASGSDNDTVPLLDISAQK